MKGTCKQKHQLPKSESKIESKVHVDDIAKNVCSFKPVGYIPISPKYLYGKVMQEAGPPNRF